MERCNTPWRQRVARLGRAALAFAKKRANQIGALNLFLCPYTLRRVAA